MGLFDKKNIKVDNKIVFVCTGNICRSAYAEKSLAAALLKQNKFNLSVDSAGTFGLTGHRMEATTAKLAIANGLNTSHAAKRIDFFKEDDLPVFLTMSLEHRNELLKHSPSSLKRAFLLSEFSEIIKLMNSKGYLATSFEDLVNEAARLRSRVDSRQILEIDDPYKSTLEFHQRVVNEIDSYLTNILTQLK